MAGMEGVMVTRASYQQALEGEIRSAWHALQTARWEWRRAALRRDVFWGEHYGREKREFKAILQSLLYVRAVAQGRA